MILLILLGRPNCNRNSKGPAGRRPRHPIIASFIATFTEFLHNFPHFPPPLRSFFFFDWPRFSSDPASVISSQWCYSQNCHYYLKNVRLNINHDDCDEECCNETFKGSTYPYHFFFDSDRSNHFADYASMIKFTKHFSKKKKTSQQGIDRLPSLKSGN